MKRRKDSLGRVLREGESERKSGGYQYRYTVRGKRYYIYAKNLDELREKEKNIDINAEKKYTIDETFRKYIAIKKKVLSNNTCVVYENNYRVHIAPALGDKLLTDIKKSDIVDFLLSLNLKTATVKKIHVILHGMFEMALDDEIIQKNPCHNAARSLKPMSSERRALTKEQQDIFLNTVQTVCPSLYTIFVFMLETGLRAGEVCGLRWEDIDFKEKTVNIRYALKCYIAGKKIYEIGLPKSKKSIRQIPLTKKAIEMLEIEKIKQEKANIKCNMIIDGFDNFVFLTKIGTVRNAMELDKHIKRVVKRTEGLPQNLSCHILRHTFCTRLCEANINPKVIQQVMGHSSIKITMDIYTNITDNFIREEMQKFDSK